MKDAPEQNTVQYTFTAEQISQADTAKLLAKDAVLSEYTKRLDELRAEGVNKISALMQEIAAIRKNKLMSADQKNTHIAALQKQIADAKGIAAQHKDEDKELTRKAVQRVNALAAAFEQEVKKSEDAKAERHKQEYDEKIKTITEAAEKKKQDIAAAFAGKTSDEDRKELQEELTAAGNALKSALFDAKNHYETALGKCKTAKHQVYVDRVQKNIHLRNSKTSFSENFVLGLKDYAYKFTPAQFFLANGLYIAIAIFFVVCIIVAPLSGSGNLLTLSNILTILEQSSVRMFYALGVAGLILLAGTDLSVGRMVAMGAVVTGLILHPGQNIVTFFGMGPWDFTAIAMPIRVLLSVSISVILCVVFSAFAGFFSAWLKIHPFISTLATQLIIYGLLFFGTSGTPVGSIDADIKDFFGGRWELGVVNGELVTFPKLIIPAIIAIIIAWFIWNKTVLGKNMYAVGGNAEAASVSGISVFKVTMSVFIMAGIFYGLGAFFEAFKANASAGTGQGYELDAIAACVVGGISFNGGIGKLEGAVLGVIIFTGLTYCLTFLGIDTNLQFVFKGFIIIAAVALDSVKYLKKK
ncbi:MAG: ABC transporter permease subunit [Treponema sp.]|uniref:galactose/methyl galactoside ABC transporter permease MglC n=1 Tax=Treponema sp. TaxID=166 RepID=UPI003FA27EC0